MVVHLGIGVLRSHCLGSCQFSCRVQLMNFFLHVFVTFKRKHVQEFSKVLLQEAVQYKISETGLYIVQRRPTPSNTVRQNQLDIH